MRRKWFASVMLILVAGFAFGQTGSPRPSTNDKPKSDKQAKKSDLELALEEALKNNPDLRVAVAKAAEADAQLSRARAQVVQKVVAAYQAIDKAKANLAAAEASYKNTTKEGRQTAAANVAQAKAAVAAAEGEMDYLTGKSNLALKIERLYAQSDTLLPVRQRVLEALGAAYEQQRKSLKTQANGPAADRIRKALARKARFNFNNVNTLQVLETIRAEAKRADIHIQANTKGDVWNETVTANLGEVSVATALQLLEDALGGYRVVVRDYGLLIAPQDKVPPGAITLAVFLEQSKDTSGSLQTK